MPQIDLTHLKTQLSEIHNQQRANQQALWQSAAPERAQKLRRRQEIDEFVKSFYAKAGLDIGKLNRLRAEHRNDQHNIFKKEQAEAAKSAAAKDKAFQQLVQQRRTATNFLTDFYPHTFITLTTPFLIWEYPHPDWSVLVDYGIEPSNSWLKFLLDTNTGSDLLTFSFKFLWANDQGYDAFVNIWSILALSGFCEADANAGIFDGDTASLNMTGMLKLFRVSGWPNPSDNDNYDTDISQSQIKAMASQRAHGGSIFGGHDSQSIMFDALAPYIVSRDNFFIPSGAVVIFEMDLQIFFSIDGDPNVGNAVIANFANDANNWLVRCPYVELEVIRPIKPFPVAI